MDSSAVVTVAPGESVNPPFSAQRKIVPPATAATAASIENASRACKVIAPRTAVTGASIRKFPPPTPDVSKRMFPPSANISPATAIDPFRVSIKTEPPTPSFRTPPDVISAALEIVKFRAA